MLPMLLCREVIMRARLSLLAHGPSEQEERERERPGVVCEPTGPGQRLSASPEALTPLGQRRVKHPAQR